MKKILVIGSTVVDIIINVDYLPGTGQDVNVMSQEMSLGGCAYNVSDTLRHFDIPHILFSPVGTGIFGNFVRNELKARNISTPVPTPNMDNGCCYCFIEPSGERTFISCHGAEYLIYKEWLEKIDTSEIEAIYICGIEIEDNTGSDIVEFLEQNKNIPVFFAPGPRNNSIPTDLLKRILKLSPILHLNLDETLQFTNKIELIEAAEALYKLTNNTIIVTCGSEGSCYYENGKLNHVDAVKVKQIDTIGAGDAHIGSIIASYYKKYDMEKSLKVANLVSSAVVETKGALLSDEKFKKLHLL
jgi:sugar/nucleoside kinase (ribokinase family)